MTRGLPRRPASSRAPLSRPRRVAGQGGPPAPAPPEPPPEPKWPTDLKPPTGRPLPARRPGLTALFDSRRATAVLAGLAVLLAAAAGGLFWWDARHGEGAAGSSDQPVVIGGDDATAAVDAAAQAAETIVAVSYEDYDQEVEEAAALMTDAFAEKYRRTAGDIEAAFVGAKTQVQARVVAQGVVRATRTEVQALVFLNQYISKDGGDTTYTPYRALVTVVHTESGWLVSDLETK